jgi:DNA-binding NarL/FixJ family response regulator
LVAEALSCHWLDPRDVLHVAHSWFCEPYELCLLDAAVPPGELSCVVSQMRCQLPACRLLFLVPESAMDRIVELTRFGSHGCVRECGSLEELCDAIRTVQSGKPYFSPELANALITQLNDSGSEKPWTQYVDDAQLTLREREVLRLIASENLSNKQIARRLHVSLYTVKNHVHNIIEKLDVSDRHAAAQLAKRRNLVWSA